MSNIIKTSSIYEDWSKDEWEQYLENLYDKLDHDIPLDAKEEEDIKVTPDEIIQEVDEKKVQEEGVVPESSKKPKVRYITRKPERQPKHTPEEIQELEEIIKESPEAEVLNTFFPEILEENKFFRDEDDQPIHPLYIDTSLNTLFYLRAIGFRSCTWHIGPEHKSTFNSKNEMKNHCKPTEESNGIPICDFLNGKPFSIDELIQNADDHSSSHGYFPPKPIEARSHVGCACFLVCNQPNTPEEISDQAPGVPAFGSPEEKLHYKTEIFNRIASSPMTVDRWTVLSKEVYKNIENSKNVIVDEWDVRQALHTTQGIRRYKKRLNYEANYFGEWTKIASEEWAESLKPVAITTGYVFRSLLGPIRPVPNTYIGFQTNVQDQYSLVYLGNLARSIVAPIEYVKELRIKENLSLDIDANTFVRIGDVLGIVIKVFNDKKILCYIPEYGSTVFTDSVVPLEVL